MEPPTVEECPERLVVGRRIRTSNDREMIPGEGRIGATWEAFEEAGGVAAIPNTTDEGTGVGVYTDYDGEGTGEYALVIGAEVTSFDAIPDDHVAIRVPAGRYARFAVDGPVPDGIIETWGRIWNWFESNDELERAFTTDYERYPKGKAPAIYVAVK